MKLFSHLSSGISMYLQEQYAMNAYDVQWQFSRDKSHGDIATACALQLAKVLKKSPKELAHEICEIVGKEDIVEKCEIADPGFINVWLKANILIESLKDTKKACSVKKKNNKSPIVVDYSGPNIAKPLGIHHILSTVIGQSVCNIYSHLGYECIGVNHLGDWGTQFGKLAVALDKWSKKSVKESSVDELLALYVRFHEEAESDASLNDEARKYFKKLEEGEAQVTAFWKDVVDVSMKEILKLYDRLHVDIKYHHGESMYQKDMNSILEEGMQKNVFKEGNEGAIIVEFPEESGLPVAIVKKGDSATIYMTRDLAQIRYRIKTWNPHSMYYVVDRAQQLHFQQLFAIVALLGWEVPHLEHLVFGRMKFKEKHMSTRKGNILKLEDVLNEAVERAKTIIQERGDAIQSKNPSDLAEMMGVGSLVYGVLSQNRKMDMVFDWNTFLSFEGNSAPYIQYTHARTCSVLRKGKIKTVAKIPTHILSIDEKERVLILTLMQFSDVLLEACESHMPNILAGYLYRICQDFNSFYNDLPIVNAEEPVRTLRLFITYLTASVIKTGAQLLTIRVPDRM